MHAARLEYLPLAIGQNSTTVRSAVNHLSSYGCRVPPDRISKALCAHVARLLKEKREERGLSLNVVAQRAGLSWHGVKLVENGLRNPTLDTLVRISVALEIHLEEIIGRARKLAAAEAK